MILLTGERKPGVRNKPFMGISHWGQTITDHQCYFHHNHDTWDDPGRLWDLGDDISWDLGTL